MKYSNINKPLVCMQTHSTCYNKTSKMIIKGVLWHSTGANNPRLRRYVQPWDDSTSKEHKDNTYTNAEWINILGKNKNKNDWNHKNRRAGLNCWIGKLDDGTVTTVQTMPWDFKPGGCASGKNGSCNSGWIQFEICEDSLKDADYFNKIYKEACEITAYLCKKFNINPTATVMHGGKKVPTILCHQDAYRLGLGSNHGDVYHWFSRYGKTMDSVRNDVAALLRGANFKFTEEAPASDTAEPTVVAPIEPILIRNLTAVCAKTNTVKVELITSANFNKYSWSYTLTALTGFKKSLSKDIKVSSEKTELILKKLTPNTAYSLEICAEDAFKALIKSPLIVFNTIQDYPQQVSNVTFEINTVDLLTGNCSFSFTPPASWGDTPSRLNRGYRVSLFINGIEKGFSDDIIGVGTTTVKAMTILDLLNKLKIENLGFNDTIQIGIQPWVTDEQNNYIFAEEFPKCSKSVYLEHALKIVSKVFINIKNNIKPVIFYHTK